MKNYVVEFRFAGRCYVSVEAENEEVAKAKTLEKVNLTMKSYNGDVTVQDWEWDSVDDIDVHEE